MVKLLWCLLLMSILVSTPMVMGHGEEGEEMGYKGEDVFLLQRSKQLMKTDVGEFRVVKGFGGRVAGIQNSIHIGFINMEPKTLFIPQYIDSSLIIFVCRGEVKVGTIYKDALEEKKLKTGDIYSILAGSTFYMLNTGRGQRLQVICSIDTSESLELDVFQSFFIGGGMNPPSVLAGFDRNTLKTAFNVSGSELDEILTSQRGGPIVSIADEHEPRMWASLLQLKQRDSLQQLYDIEEEENTWVWRKLMNSMLGKKTDRDKKKTDRKTDSYNIYNRKPDFKNDYGWSVAIEENDYSPLKQSGIGVYLVNLTAGSILAPHINPTATEYGIILRGSGSIQVVYPNGSLAMNAKVDEGDVFWVPRYFPFCQIASRSGPMEFFGFATSARKNWPQFLVGARSILRTMKGPELAMAFGVSEKRFSNFTDKQREAIILPSAPMSPLLRNLSLSPEDH
ncbi:hypothetical protein GIB67_002113, partial [Kingdonia uniflora]